MSIYKKIRESKKKASAAKLNVFEATARGVAAGQEAVESAEESAAKYKNPITYKSSALRKNGDPKYQGRRNYKGDAVDFYLDEVQNQGGSITIKGKKDDYDGSGGYMSNEAWEDFLQTPAGKAYTEKHSDKTVDLPGSTTKTGTIKPLKETIEEPMSQQYNMGFDQAEDANWARGAMRRGLNRDERKDNKNRVQKMRTNDPEAYKKYKESMKKSRKNSFLGLGIGGDRQERKIQALKDAGKLPKDYQSYKSQIAEANADMNSEERKQKIESATMNKYNMPIDSYGDFKPARTKTQNMSGEGLPEITDDDIGTKTFTNYFAPKGEGNFSFGSGVDYVGEFKKASDEIINKKPSLYQGSSGLLKKAKQYRGKFGRGAGYKK